MTTLLRRSRLKQRARAIKRDTYTLYLACRDPRTPWYVKLFAGGIVAYAISPIDLIPDFIPVLGYLDDLILSERTVAGALLVLIAVLIPASGFLGAVGLPTDVWGMPLERKLRTIAEHPIGWRAVNTYFVIALVLSSLGLAAVARQLRGTDLAHIADLAVLAYVIGAVLWIVELVSRLSVIMAAADETLGRGVVPVWAGPLAMWGSGLFIVYAALSNLAVLGLGAALLRTDLVPGWAAGSALGMSILVLALLVITRNNIPAMNLIGPIVIGVALLLPRT